MLTGHSLHTKDLLYFVSDEDFVLLNSVLARYDVDYTFESKANLARSTIDHFMVTNNLKSSVVNVECEHSVDNTSDHSVLSVKFDIHVDNIVVDTQARDKLMWSRAPDADVEYYKICLNDALDKHDKCHVSNEVIQCSDKLCKKHNVGI